MEKIKREEASWDGYIPLHHERDYFFITIVKYEVI